VSRPSYVTLAYRFYICDHWN